MIDKVISHYKILEKLGEGGMGEVYLAEDTKLDRTVALKFLRPEVIGDPTAKERFIREAKAASAINHRNISTIYEIDEYEGRDFICMEYVDGQTLKQLTINNDQLSVETIIDYGIQAAEALQAAHEKDIVHRDIKPDNIMVTEKGEVKVTDFGLAKFKETSTMTKTGTTVGTISYMSPEQTRGEHVDQRSDIWSLGVVLYEMLSGELPFKGDYETAVIYSILNQTQKPLTDFRSGVAKSLELIVNKCLEKNAADRYQDVDEVLEDLRRFKRDPDSKIRSSKPKGSLRYPEKWLIPKKTSAIFLIILIIIVGGYFVLNRFVIKEPPQSVIATDTDWKNSIAILPFENINADPNQENLCEILTKQIRTSLSRLRVLKVIGRRSVKQYKNTKKTIPEIGKELNVASILEGSISKIGNQIRVIVQLVETNEGNQLWADHYDYGYQLDSIFVIFDDVSNKTAGALIKNLSTDDLKELKTDKPKNAKVYEYYTKGYHFFHNRFSSTRNEEDFKNSETMFKKAIELAPSYIPPYLELADLYTTYGWYVAIEESYKEREDYWAKANSLRKIAYDIDPNSAEANLAMGKLLEIDEKPVEAFEKFKSALALNPNWITANHTMATHLGYVGLYDVAFKYYNKVVELDPIWPEAYTNRSFWCYSCIGDYEKAEADFQTAFDLDPNHQETVILYSMYLIRTKKFEQAREYCMRWSKIDTSALLPRVFIQAFNGNKEEAINLTKKIEGNWTGIIYMHKYWIYTVLGKKEEAFEYLIMHGELFAETGWTLYLVLLNDPIYDEFRDHPHFQALLVKHKKLYEENLEKYRI